MDYGGQPCPVSSPTCGNLFTYTFATPGTYLLKVTYQNIGADDITLTVDQNTQPNFEIYSCAGSKVDVNITDKVYDSYSIDFNNDGIIETIIPSGNNQNVTYNYGANGNYNISVKGKKVNAANNCAANVQAFTALSTLPAPTFNTLDALDASTLQLGFTDQPNIQYQVEFATNGATNFQIYKNLYAVSSLTVPSLSIDNNFYCFRLNTHDPCTNTNTATVPVCSQAFNLLLASGVNKLNWQTAGAISSIDVQRDGTNYTTLPGSDRNYNDLTVTCKTQYCYQLKATYPNGAVSTSLQKCGTTFLTDVPSAIDNASIVVNDTQAQILWKQNPVYPSSRFTILRSVKGGIYSPVGNSATSDFTDNSYDTNAGICYKINYIDDCDNVSAEGVPLCPIVLTGTLDDKNEVTLNWSDYTGWTQGVKNYTLQKFNSAGALIKTVTTTGNTYLDNQLDFINQEVFYKIIASANEFGVTQSESNKIRIEKRVNLFFPTAFNPDSRHAENSTFIVKGHYISSLQLMIFDRWGTMVFSSDQNEAWDGKKDGIQMPTATYVWTAQGTDLIGKSFKEAGTVLLIRHKN
jgi:gliding motility-associated-like protein